MNTGLQCECDVLRPFIARIEEAGGWLPVTPNPLLEKQQPR